METGSIVQAEVTSVFLNVKPYYLASVGIYIGAYVVVKILD
jgi:hypothetical protein